MYIEPNKFAASLLVLLFILMFVFNEWRFSALNDKISALEQDYGSAAKQASNSQYYAKPEGPGSQQSEVSVKTQGPVRGNNTVKDVFVTQNGLDGLKTRYEELFVTYLFLKKCGKTNPEDYRLINFVLERDLKNINANAELKYEILAAAKGTYDELYTSGDCAAAELLPTIQKYKDYISRISGSGG